jgi:hypothetical protein
MIARAFHVARRVLARMRDRLEPRESRDPWSVSCSAMTISAPAAFRAVVVGVGVAGLAGAWWA